MYCIAQLLRVTTRAHPHVYDHSGEDYPYGIGITNDVDPLYPLVVNDSGLQANLWLGTKGIET